MSDDITSDGKISNDEKSSGLGKLESMSHEELIKLVKTQLILRKKLETKIHELTNSNTSFNQIQEELQNELLIVRSSLNNESQKSSFHSELLSNSISTIIDLFQLSISLPDRIDNEFIQIYKNELEQKQENYKQIFDQIEQEKTHLQQRIEDLEFFNEEIKLENDDLRLKSRNYQRDKQLMEKEIDNYRRQIEDFEEQFQELQRENDHNHYETYDKSQQQPSITIYQSDENFDDIIFQCMNYILTQIDDNNRHISKSSSTSSLLLASDIPTLLHSVGITNCTDEEFSVPLNFESVLRLCTLLIERCRVLQYILLKNNDINLNSLADNDYDNQCVSFLQNKNFEQCKILIHKQDHIALDTLFERIYTGMNQTINSNDWQIIIEKPIDQNIRLEFDSFKFVSEEIEHDLIRLRSQYDQLSKETENQRYEISLLKNRLQSNNSYEKLKKHQTQLEEKLVEQCEKTIQLENILKQANIDKTKFDQLKQIEISYNELQEKYHIAEQLEDQLKELNKNFNEKIFELKQQNDLFEKFKTDYNHQHFHLLERNETIHLLKLQLEEHEQFKEKYDNQINNIQNEFEQQKLLLLNSKHNLLISKPHDELNVKNLQLENEKLQQIIIELNEKIEKQNSDSGENIQEFKEKYQKMKILLTRLKKELQEKHQQPKQSSIDLELADYEKTIQNLKNDLINKDKDLQDLRDELSNTTEKYSCLKLEIQSLEQQKLQTEERANKFKALLDIAKKELQNAKNLELQRYENEDHVRGLIETLQNQLDSNKILIIELINDKQQLTEKLNNQIETSQKTISLLEQNFRIAKHDLDIAKQDYDTLQDDFNSYKIRAQSVLKQHQSTQRDRTPSLADKQVELEETIEKFRTTLQEANNKIQLLNSETEALQKEQNRLIEIQAKLINESRKREQDLRKQHQIEIDKIENECLQRINDSHDMLKNVTIQNETLSTAFKEQIATIEIDHERSISILQNQLQLSEQEIEQLKTRIELLHQSNSDSSQIGIKNDSKRDNTLAWSVYEHQQGEGFESANIEHQLSDVPVKTIENASSAIQNNTPPSLASHISSDNIELERQRIEDELNKTKLRLVNITELFNESELNNKRLNEQVALLKDEIRRIERNMDRAESISNLEYLKNIILKFFILKSTPERLQLIPVLVTMLKLSPDEQAQLVRVANMPTIIDESLRSDESSSQPLTNGANSPSWSSYLNIW